MHRSAALSTYDRITAQHIRSCHSNAPTSTNCACPLMQTTTSSSAGLRHYSGRSDICGPAPHEASRPPATCRLVASSALTAAGWKCGLRKGGLSGDLRPGSATKMVLHVSAKTGPYGHVLARKEPNIEHVSTELQTSQAIVHSVDVCIAVQRWTTTSTRFRRISNPWR